LYTQQHPRLHDEQQNKTHSFVVAFNFSSDAAMLLRFIAALSEAEVFALFLVVAMALWFCA
jgi:hypothetical protein